jgi:TonB family protein
MSSKDYRVKVLFVCVGNACRSPMAEAIARIDAPDAIEAFSAGLSPIGSVARMTKQTLKRNGYRVRGLEPKSISTEVWERADIVINLSGRSREESFRQHSKVEDWEIEDPFGKDEEVYQQVFEAIQLRVTELARVCRKRIAAARTAERLAQELLQPAPPVFTNLNRANGQRNPRGRRQRWGKFAAFGALIGFASLTFAWVTTLPDPRTKISADVTQRTERSSEPVQSPTLPPVGEIANDPGPGETMDTQVHVAEPLLAETEKSTAIPDLSLEEMNRQPSAIQRPSASRIVKTASRPAKSVAAPNHSTSEPQLATANVNSRLVAKVQPLPVGSLAATLAKPEMQITPPVVSTANLPADFPPAALKEIKSPMPPPKPAAVSASTTAAVAIVADPYPSLRIPDGGISKKQRQATSLQLGHLLSRVEPIYPEAAKQQGIQGTVKLHAIIGRQGSVENLDPVDGSPVLVAAAVNAVRQWRYSETLLAGRSVETEEDIAITFRLSNPAAPVN